MRVPFIILALLTLPVMVQAEAFKPVDPEIVLEVSLLPKLMNDDVPSTTPPISVDEGAYLFGIAYQWDSNVRDIFGLAKSTQEYYELFFSKHVYDGDDYIESVEEIGVLYGRKYFIMSEDQRGLAYGWYGGFSMWSSEGYDYSGSSAFGAYTEDGFSALIAAELRYDYRHRITDTVDVLIYPSAAVTFDKDFNELTIFPRVMLGLVF